MSILWGIVSGVISFMIGGLWYGLIFRDAWVKASGISQETIDNSDGGKKEMLVTALIEVVLAIILVYFFKHSGVQPLLAGLIVAMISVISALKNYIFEMRPAQLILINESYKAICIIIASLFALL